VLGSNSETTCISDFHIQLLAHPKGSKPLPEGAPIIEPRPFNNTAEIVCGRLKAERWTAAGAEHAYPAE
jgi:hypothetical protein